jgi:Na+/H+-dicarboxylate symporter
MGLVPRLIIAIVVGIILGSYAPEPLNRLIVTLSTLFSSFLKFIIPLMILSFVTMGIADLTQGAGKLLLITAAIAYSSTLIAGTCAYFVAINLFPHFITGALLDVIAKTASNAALPVYFSLPIPPLLDVMSAVVTAFIVGLCISSMRGKEIHDALYNVFSELSVVINTVLHNVIIPLLPLYICGTFIDLTVTGQTFSILQILWKVFLTVIALHLICLAFQFTVSGAVSKKSPIFIAKNQIPGYLSAIGTQSSAATIPVNLKCAEADGV